METEEKVTRCPLCGKQGGPLKKIFRSITETEVEICPECYKQVEEENNAYTRETLTGCLIVSIFAVVLLLIITLISLCMQ